MYQTFRHIKCFSAPRQCIICGKLAVFECLKCFGDHGTGLDSTAFCDSCFKTAHAHAKRLNHKPKELKVPGEFKTFANSQASTFQQPRLFMELFAVLCIETSHYVSFVKCGSSPDSPWCLFDSMADRKGIYFIAKATVFSLQQYCVFRRMFDIAWHVF